MSQVLLPYTIDSRPTRQDLTASAGLPLVLETMRAIVPADDYDNLSKELGISPAVARRHLESIVLLIAAGGDVIDDVSTLRADKGLQSLIGFCPSCPTQIKDFLYGFHRDQHGKPLSDEQDRALSVAGKAQIRAESPALLALERILARTVHALQVIGRHTRATLDVDATLIESAKKQALRSYEGSRAYQPQMGWWSEAGIWVKDQFRDGNVPAEHGILDFARTSFAALPSTITHRRFRGDSACYTAELIVWLDDQGIEFGISADMSESLTAHVRRLHGGDWMPYTSESGPSLTEERECAEVFNFQPEWSDRRKRKENLRFIAIRVRSKQSDLFSKDGWKHFAIVTNKTGNAADVLR